MRGPRGLLLWCLLVVLLAALLLLTRPAHDAGVKAAGLATLAGVLGVLATRGLLRRLVCAVVAVLAVVPLTHGRALLGAPLLAAGILGVAISGRWPSMSRRYDAPGADQGSTSAEPDLWTRIERGEDPTA
ncbi:MAG: hypothetical protein QOK42_2512 [Frankiaceae bacterium]|nr:hypothetical protein [Frankiaceae bacterium]MDX6275239.1 hypothetical protein [Frankiales bacterium]